MLTPIEAERERIRVEWRRYALNQFARDWRRELAHCAPEVLAAERAVREASQAPLRTDESVLY